jgi:hypothetical protein
MRRDTLSKQLHDARGRAFIARERAKKLAEGSLRAAARLTALVDAESEHVALNASTHLLAIEGVSPIERSHVQVDQTIRAGYVIDLRLADRGEPIVDVTPAPAQQLEPQSPAVTREPSSFKPDARWSSSALPMKPDRED